MATILIYEPNHSLAQKLCDSLRKEQYNAILCGENESEPEALKEETAPLILLDAQLKWTVCRPMLENFSKRGCSILFLTGDRKMSAHLLALYAGSCDVLVAPFSMKALKAQCPPCWGQMRSGLICLWMKTKGWPCWTEDGWS